MALVNDAIRSIVRRIYGATAEAAVTDKIASLLENIAEPEPLSGRQFSEADVVLITYGDSLRSKAQAPLQTLNEFAARYLRKSFSAIHFLPFFPYSSDDGFSVMDFFAIDPDLGSWEDVKAIGNDFENPLFFKAGGPQFHVLVGNSPGTHNRTGCQWPGFGRMSHQLRKIELHIMAGFGLTK